MKYSKQRDIILKNILERCDHPTASMVYQDVQKQIPNISLGTVYRNLTVLVNMGKIHKIVMPGMSDRFDRTLKSHSHFYCRSCGNLYDIMLENIEDIDALVSNYTGHKIVSHDIVFTGVCKDC